MGSRNISIPDDVYERLRDGKDDDESFGDAIDRLLDRRPLSSFWGEWSEETARETRATVERGRTRSDEKTVERYE